MNVNEIAARLMEYAGPYYDGARDHSHYALEAEAVRAMVRGRARNDSKIFVSAWCVVEQAIDDVVSKLEKRGA